MFTNKNWFSLIEVVVATSILTIWVFSIYKLIWNNLNLISNANTQKTIHIIEKSLIECLKYFNVDTLSWSYNINYKFSINFWDDLNSCLTWSYDSNYNFSWVLLNNKEFFNVLYIEKKEDNNIKINYEIIWDKKFKNYLILKK